MAKLKILQINKLYYPVTGGIERVVQQIAEGLKNEIELEVLVCKQRGKTVTEYINGVKITRAGSLGVLFSMPISLSFFSKVRKLSKDKDILHFHMPFPLGDFACLLSGYRGKVVLWWHSDIVRQKKLMKLYQPIMEWLLRRADVIVVATQGHIDGSDYLPKYKDKCVIIPYGVDSVVNYKGDQYLKEVGSLHRDKLKLLFVGRLVYYKGCEVLLRAVSKVDGIELSIVGNGELEDKLKEETAKLGILDKVRFCGNLDEDELNIAFQECDVFVLPSILKSEAFGLVQIEAMAYGKPVINTSLPSGVPYVSLDKVTGLTVPPDDVQALADAIQWMVDHEEERIEMGKKARERVKEYFQMDTMLDKILKLYRNIHD